MDTTYLGRTGVKVSELCLGTMTFGAAADEATSRDIMTACFDAGINMIDCADIYTGGESERIVGRMIAGRRHDVVLATKAYFPKGDGPNERGASRRHMTRALESSLERLGTDHVDIFYIHRFDDHCGLDEVLRGLELLVQQGKILYPAVSNFAAWQVAKALGIQAMRGWAPLTCIQPMYNLLKRQAEVELLPMASSEGLGVFPYSPLAAGLLTGKYSGEPDADLGRLSHNTMYQARYGDPNYAEVARQFAALARELGHHPASLAIAWVGAHSSVSAPILGARNVEQIRPALASVDIEVTPELYRRIAQLSPEPPPATDRNEEGSSATLDRR